MPELVAPGNSGAAERDLDRLVYQILRQDLAQLDRNASRNGDPMRIERERATRYVDSHLRELHRAPQPDATRWVAPQQEAPGRADGAQRSIVSRLTAWLLRRALRRIDPEPTAGAVDVNHDRGYGAAPGQADGARRSTATRLTAWMLRQALRRIDPEPTAGAADVNHDRGYGAAPGGYAPTSVGQNMGQGGFGQAPGGYRAAQGGYDFGAGRQPQVDRPQSDVSPEVMTAIQRSLVAERLREVLTSDPDLRRLWQRGDLQRVSTYYLEPSRATTGSTRESSRPDPRERSVSPSPSVASSTTSNRTTAAGLTSSRRVASVRDGDTRSPSPASPRSPSVDRPESTRSGSPSPRRGRR
ncbi:hypothetical protein [Micromonospora radicis]|uniref:Uncharacterized protein n=1 Tax=Micromonospora radicis TaxID=1894971 RepID=A0A418MYH0_9ACTN|nr:hypothetical protein [Micromonospora radicis]RIV40228.1 hypothetical protein D2L64_05055 [Micromonospora radicis]